MLSSLLSPLRRSSADDGTPQAADLSLDAAPLLMDHDGGGGEPDAATDALERQLEQQQQREGQSSQRSQSESAAEWRGACKTILLLLLFGSLSALAILGVLHWRARLPLMQAWVLGSNPDRFASSCAAIRQAFPSVDWRFTSIPMVPLTDPRIEYRRKADAWSELTGSKARHPWEQPLHTLKLPHSTHKLRALSTSLGWMDMWARAGSEPDLADEEWVLMFEDDVAVVPQPSDAGCAPFDYTHELLSLLAFPPALADGIVSMGLCAPRFAMLNPRAPMERWNQFNSSAAPAWLSSRRGFGMCTHAMAFTKRRARTLSADMASILLEDFSHASDVNLRTLALATGKWPFVLGASRRSPLLRDHWGLFYQDRKHYKSIIQQDEPSSSNSNNTTSSSGTLAGALLSNQTDSAHPRPAPVFG